MVDLIMKDILGTPAILVGLFALIGLLLQKKDVANVISGTLKTIMGFVILGAGAEYLSPPLITSVVCLIMLLKFKGSFRIMKQSSH